MSRHFHFGGCPECGYCIIRFADRLNYFGTCPTDRVKWWTGNRLYALPTPALVSKEELDASTQTLALYREVEPIYYARHARDRLAAYQAWSIELCRVSAAARGQLDCGELPRLEE